MHIRSLITGFATLLIAGLSSSCFCTATPRQQKLADCTTNSLAFRLIWPAGDLFQIVLGIPYQDTNALTFRGELVFRQSTTTIVRVPIGSYDVTPCNWLENHASAPHVAGYILTWSRTNASERLDHLFTKGQSYDVEVQFTEPPPPTSTLWLHWIGEVGD